MLTFALIEPRMSFHFQNVVLFQNLLSFSNCERFYECCFSFSKKVWRLYKQVAKCECKIPKTSTTLLSGRTPKYIKVKIIPELKLED